MSADVTPQPFTDPLIYEVNTKQVDYHWSTRYLTFSDVDGLHQFYLDHHPGYIPVTVFLREGDDVRARLVWSHPQPIIQSDF